MAQSVTLSANDATNPGSGTFVVPAGKSASYSVAITGTITVTLQRRIGGTTWIPVEDGYTSNQTKQIVSPGEYRLIASGTSGGSAVTFLEVDK